MTVDQVYLDHAATTPVDSRVIGIMESCMRSDGTFANPASVHVAGRRSAAIVAEARRQLAALLNAESTCLVWTSGATESDNLAIRGAAHARSGRGRHLVTMPTEHKAVTATFRALEKEGFEVTWLAPDEAGLLAPQALEQALRQDTQLVSVMHVNNETGVVQDIRSLGEVCRDRDVLFHTDAAQSVGKLPIDLASLPVDLLSLTAHKFYGPQGIGALFIASRPPCRIFPLMYGGSQETRLRPGTLPVHLIAGAGAAAEIAAAEQENDFLHATELREQLWQGLRDIGGIIRNGDGVRCYPGILNISVSGVHGESLLLGMEPVCVASGSACNAASAEPSQVLRALGRSDAEANSAIRFSFGRGTTAADVDVAIARCRWAVEHLRSIAPVA